MSPVTPDPIPPQLEEQVLSILEGECRWMRCRLQALILCHPRHAAALREWLRLAGLPFGSPEQTTAGRKTRA